VPVLSNGVIFFQLNRSINFIWAIFGFCVYCIHRAIRNERIETEVSIIAAKYPHLKNEMDGAFGACGGSERHIQGFGSGNLRERDRWGDQDIDGR
jgi:hypothetical protein